MGDLTCVDIGNQFLKYAVFNSDGNIVSQGRLINQDAHSFISRSLNENNRLFICDVGQKLNDLAPDIEHNFLQIKHKFPFTLAYKTPETLGLDRLCGLAGALHLFPFAGPILVCSLGSCITYDFLSQERVFMGGTISPGLTLRYNAMHDYTAKLPSLNFEPYNEMIGNSTANAMHAGVQQGIIAELNHFLSYFKSLYPTIQVVFCGGDASYFENKVKTKIFAAPNLNLIGLYHIAKLNDL